MSALPARATIKRLPALISVALCNPKVVFNDPVKELETLTPVWVIAETTLKVLPRVVAPEILAVPPTSRVVSVLLPALIPSKAVVLVNSKLPAREALELKSALPVTDRVPVRVSLPLATILPPMDALLVSSKPVNWVEAAVKFQKPVMVWLAEREAGPLT